MEKKPNILVIHADSFDGRLMGCMGHPALDGATPHLDRLAEEGTLFENTCSNFPLCCPSRASFWSGRFAHNIGAWNNVKGLEPDSPTAETRLAASGYGIGTVGRRDHLSGGHSLTAALGSWTRAAAIPRPVHGEGRPPRVLPDPLSRVHGKDWEAVDAGREWLRHASHGDRPFLLSVGLHVPHHSFGTSQYYLDRIEPETVSLPPEDRLDHPLLPLQRLQKNWGHALDPEGMRLRRRIYFAMISEVDEMVGDLLQALDEYGLSDRTWVFFLSDHGEMAGEHRQYIKLTHFEASIRVPLIVRGPGEQAGRRVQRPVSLVDVCPTLLELAGEDIPAECDGHSLLPELTGGVSDRPEEVFAEHHSTTCPTGSFMLRSDEWKYTAFPGFPPLLFNLREDPDELRDLSRARPDQCAVMDGKLREVVDYEAVDRNVKDYDREQFSRWRERQRRDGTYDSAMAAIYSGKKREGVTPIPWRGRDEERIVRWLTGDLPPLPDISDGI